MKTIQDVKAELQTTIELATMIKYPKDKKEKLQLSKYKKRIRFLNKILLALENGTLDYFVHQKDKLEEKINLISKNYIHPGDNLSNSFIAKHRKLVEKSYGIDKARVRLQSIDYILN